MAYNAALANAVIGDFVADMPDVDLVAYMAIFDDGMIYSGWSGGKIRSGRSCS